MSFLIPDPVLPSDFLNDATIRIKPRSLSTPLFASESPEVKDTLFFKTPPSFPIHPKPLKAIDLAVAVEFIGEPSKDAVIWDSDVGISNHVHLAFNVFLTVADTSILYFKPPKVSSTRLDVSLIPPRKTIGLRNLAPHSKFEGISETKPRTTFTPLNTGMNISLRYPTDLQDTPIPHVNLLDFSGFRGIPEGTIETSWHRHLERDTSRRGRRWCLRGAISAPVSVFRKADTRAFKFAVAVCVHDDENMLDWATGEQTLTVTLLRTVRELTPPCLC